ncbi:MAG: imidazoleglycerol-phosphate dehydratase HisB [Candidatus Burarchaeum sp.]|nr:imidazoleglycerol-phosphate dehydratase HisB [Candidatus Burarchaeum sp.]MDO8339186.1 imidazoleglycerol-phosphate dehydratase HisB [Candidatus Burarchaeum sp.]
MKTKTTKIARTAKIKRKTGETDIALALTLDGSGRSEIATGIGFFDHMLCSFAKHGLFDLELSAKGDLQVDQHHLVEDTGIALGEAFAAALGDKKGIARAGSFAFPMDETLSLVSVDFGGRSLLTFDAKFSRGFIGRLQSDLVREFFAGFVQGARCNVCVRLLYEGNDHHKCEGIFKGFARALAQACEVRARAGAAVPSTKGVI